MGNIGPVQLIIVLVIIILLFGTKRLKSLGGDLGSAIKGFKKEMTEKDKDADFEQTEAERVESQSKTTAESKVSEKEQA